MTVLHSLIAKLCFTASKHWHCPWLLESVAKSSRVNVAKADRISVGLLLMSESPFTPINQDKSSAARKLPLALSRCCFWIVFDCRTLEKPCLCQIPFVMMLKSLTWKGQLGFTADSQFLSWSAISQGVLNLHIPKLCHSWNQFGAITCLDSIAWNLGHRAEQHTQALHYCSQR